MSRYLGTRGRASLAVSVCDRCQLKVRYVDLMADGNSPGLRVCRKCHDPIDRWRLPPRQTETISLQHPRPEQNIQADQPVASFTMSPVSGFAPLSVTFTDTSTGSPTGWSWDFNGDGVIDSTAQNPTYVYSAPGLYSVTLVTNNASGRAQARVLAAIQVVSPIDPQFALVSLLAHGNTFTDSSVNALSGVLVGGVSIAADSNAFLGSSISFTPGSPVNYVEFTKASFLGGTSQPYTIEFFVDLSSVIGSNSDASFIYFLSGATLVLAFGTLFVNTIQIRGTSGNYQVSVADYLARMHIAITRDGSGNGAWYINGILQSPGPATGTTYDFDKVRIGNNASAPASASDGGFASEVRVTKAVRYTSNFTPPTASFPNS